MQLQQGQFEAEMYGLWVFPLVVIVWLFKSDSAKFRYVYICLHMHICVDNSHPVASSQDQRPLSHPNVDNNFG